MMATILEQSATLMCPHMGQVRATSSITRVTLGGVAPLAKNDVCLVVACPFTLGASPHPCSSVEWLTATTRVTVEGKALVLDASTGLCKAADAAPQGSPLVVVSQTRVSAK
jgi:hypothetical protein